MKLILALTIALALASPAPATPPVKTACQRCATECRERYEWDQYWIWYVWQLESALCTHIQDPQEWQECVRTTQRALVRKLEELDKRYRICRWDCCCDADGSPCPFDGETVPPQYWGPDAPPKVPPSSPPRKPSEWVGLGVNP